MRMLWHISYWDGPLSGLCLYEGRMHWFQIKGDLEPDQEKREFEIIALTDEQIRAEEEHHALWVKYVGSHCDYDENNQRAIGNLRPKSLFHDFSLRRSPSSNNKSQADGQAGSSLSYSSKPSTSRHTPCSERKTLHTWALLCRVYWLQKRPPTLN
jgi:hypothetical protein